MTSGANSASPLPRDFRCCMVCPPPMTRFLCCLVLSCLVTACVPPKPAETVETPATRPSQEKPATPSDEEPPAMPRVVNPGGMRLPPLTERLPDRNDMTPTATPATGGGVIATPPTPRQPVNE
jgi:hypothetical protein